MLIDIRDITKVYEMGAQKVRALDGVSVRLDRGEYVEIGRASCRERVYLCV